MLKKLLSSWIVYAVAAALATVVAALAFSAYVRESRLRAAAEATIQAKQLQIDQLEKQSADRKKALDGEIAQLEKLKRQTKTPAQVVKEITRFLPPLPQPIKLQAPPAAPGEKLQSPAPEKQAAVIPPQDLKPLFDYTVSCEECKKKLDFDQKQIAGLQEQKKILLEQRDTAVKAMKGGNFWHRLRHDAKLVFISAAVGAVVGYAAHR